MKKILLLSLLFALVLIVIFFLKVSVYNNFKTTKILTVGVKEIKVAIADTPILQAKGLSGTQSLKDDEGMFFIFNRSLKYGFWMKGMIIPIDIIWIDSNWKVIDITKNLKPETYPESFSPNSPAQYVLEVNSGFSEKYSIKIGDSVSLK